MRQLGKPALLAATYKGDAVAIAAAAMEELESTLVDTLTQLERSSPGTPGAQGPSLINPREGLVQSPCLLGAWSAVALGAREMLFAGLRATHRNSTTRSA